MAKQEQVLVIDPPNELAFTGPFTVSVSSYMKLTNPSDRKVCFKIKTTAPKRYCVKPNSGLIEQGQTVQILVSLQPFEFDPSEKNRHKFMVQAMYAPEGDFNQETLWKESDSSQLMDSKLKCVFVLPDGGDGGGGVISGGSSNNRDSDNGSTVSFKNIPPSPKNVGENDLNLKRTVEEIKKLQEEVSSLRQENIQLKEEALRQKRLAATSRSSGDDALSSSSSSASGDKSSFAASSTVVTAANPNATALSNVYLYAALAILIFGVIVGKWIL